MSKHGSIAVMASGKGNTTPEKHVARLAAEVKSSHALYEKVAKLNNGHPNKIAAYNKLKSSVTQYIELVANAISAKKIESDPNGLLNLKLTEKSALGRYADEIYHLIKETAMAERTNIQSLFDAVNEAVVRNPYAVELINAENATIPADLTKPEQSKVAARLEELMNAAAEAVRNPNNSDFDKQRANAWLMREVRRYMHFVTTYRNGIDGLGIMYRQYGDKEIEDMMAELMSDLCQHSSNPEEAKTAMAKISAGMANMSQSGAIFDNIRLGFTKVCGWVWNFAKGTVSYVVGVTIKVVKTIVSIVGLTFGQLVLLFDAMTTKDGGRSGQPGIILQAMNNV